jgi:hypothetical protein
VELGPHEAGDVNWPQRRSHMASQSVGEPGSGEKRREVHATAEISEGLRKEKILAWTSSGSSVNENDAMISIRVKLRSGNRRLLDEMLQ